MNAKTKVDSGFVGSAEGMFLFDVTEDRNEDEKSSPTTMQRIVRWKKYNDSFIICTVIVNIIYIYNDSRSKLSECNILVGTDEETIMSLGTYNKATQQELLNEIAMKVPSFEAQDPKVKVG